MGSANGAGPRGNGARPAPALERLRGGDEDRCGEEREGEVEDDVHRPSLHGQTGRGASSLPHRRRPVASPFALGRPGPGATSVARRLRRLVSRVYGGSLVNVVPDPPPHAVRRPRRASILDVAALAGVSASSISRSLRGHSSISAATRERVHEAAQQLSYSASPQASGLASGRTLTIGVVVPFVTRWFFVNVVAGAYEVLHEAGYDAASTSAPARPATASSNGCRCHAAWTRCSR